jgi:hypothetical protein
MENNGTKTYHSVASTNTHHTHRHETASFFPIWKDGGKGSARRKKGIQREHGVDGRKEQNLEYVRRHRESIPL